MKKRIEHRDIKTLEDYQEWNRQKVKDWYAKNKEKKKEYGRNYYYNITKKKALERAN